MKIIENKILPFRGFKCVNLFGVLFVRKGCKMREVDYNHERIHTEQIKEMLALPFYIWYCVEFLIKLVFIYQDIKKAYRAISFEREAYSNQDDLEYLQKRRYFRWLEYIHSS